MGLRVLHTDGMHIGDLEIKARKLISGLYRQAWTLKSPVQTDRSSEMEREELSGRKRE